MSNILQDTFREELVELLADLEHGLLQLETVPDDGEAVNRVFRTLHTVKGSGSLAGFDRLAGFVHHVEAVFEDVRAGLILVDSTLIDLTLQARDMVQAMVLEQEEILQQDIDALIAQMDHFKVSKDHDSGSREADSGSDEGLTVEGTKSFWVRFVPPAKVFERGLDPANLIRELGRQGDAKVLAQSDLPALDNFDPMTCRVVWDVLLTTGQTIENMRDVFVFVEDDSELRIELLDSEGKVDLQAVWEPCRALFQANPDDLFERLKDIYRDVSSRHDEIWYDGPEKRVSQSDRRQAGEDRRSSGIGDHGKSAVSSSVRVRSERLDKLVDLIGEMVTVQARLKQISATIEDVDLELISEEVEQLTWELRDEVLSIRMVPIGSTFNRFSRQVRDLARDLGKDVQLITEGGETELDKTVIERLSDPIMHLLRNAIDHGIESPEQRGSVGKPEKGTLHLSAGQSGASVVIEIYDDGSGLNLEKIRQKAVKSGLLQPEDDIEQANLWDLVSSPGFSTSHTITNISGRGVGLDVVRKSIDDLRGTVDLQTVEGEGSCFRLKLPLTLAIIDGLLVRIGQQRFVMPLSQIEEIIEQTRSDIQQQHGRDLLHVRGETVPYMHLRKEFSINGRLPEIEQVIIANLEGFRIGFAVDTVIGEHQTVIKSLGRMYRDVPGLSGATVLGDGSLALILDLPALMRLEEARTRAFEDKASQMAH
ncbi:MAG: chemotaxis protein CheA [Desulfuromonas sp.]|nr:MAG: chemotaxis protein CheA [Desulfuromonas sp.]